MELELQADPDNAAAVSGLKDLAREGRPRTQAFKVVWHDSPDQVLFRQGLALAERRDMWRLQRVVPGAATWLPGQSAPILQEAASPSLLAAELPAALAPVAAFQGRRTITEHRIEADLITLSIDRGMLRAVTAEHAVVRMQIQGEANAVHAAAMLMAGVVAVQVPRCSLAAQAIALATGSATPPRHLGAPVLPGSDITLSDAFAHILGHLTDVILHHAPVAAEPDSKTLQDDARVEAVHQMRVAVRRALSALSIFRSAFPDGTLNPVRDGLKALGATLGRTRDWDVFLAETAPMIASVLPPDQKLDRMIAAATRRRHGTCRTLSDYLRSPAFHRLGIELAWFAAARPWQTTAEGWADGVDQTSAEPLTVAAFAPGILQQRWKKLVSAGKQIEALDVAGLHDMRLRAKRVRYAAEMLAGASDQKPIKRFVHRVSLLQQRLGMLNDGAVAALLLDELGGPAGRHGYAVGIVIGFTASRVGKMRPRIIRAFEKIRRLPPYWT